MNICVTYYDIETDKKVTKKCLSFSFNGYEPDDFMFMPVDDPVTIYKLVTISHPIISCNHNDNYTQIIVCGYQQMKAGGMSRTTTIINMKYES